MAPDNEQEADFYQAILGSRQKTYKKKITIDAQGREQYTFFFSTLSGAIYQIELKDMISAVNLEMLLKLGGYVPKECSVEAQN